MSGATNEVGAPEIRIAVPVELVLTPRGKDLIPVLGPVVTAHNNRIMPGALKVNRLSAASGAVSGIGRDPSHLRARTPSNPPLEWTRGETAGRGRARVAAGHSTASR